MWPFTSSRPTADREDPDSAYLADRLAERLDDLAEKLQQATEELRHAMADAYRQGDGNDDARADRESR